jgi:hypothetical protein
MPVVPNVGAIAVWILGITASVSTAFAQLGGQSAIVEVARVDSIQIERESIILVQTALRGILKDSKTPVRLRLTYADGRERSGRDTVLKQLYDARLPDVARGGPRDRELIIEIGEFRRRDGGIFTVQVRLLGAEVLRGCQAFSAFIHGDGSQWRRYVLTGSPYGGCGD